jgi:toluene monooxygenase system protein E
MRKVTEQLLVTFEWDRAFVATNFILKPICDEIFLKQFARVADSLGDPLDSLLADNLYRDAERGHRWSVAFARHVIASDPSNRGVLRRIAAEWSGAGEAMVEEGVKLLTRFAPRFVQGEMEAEVRHTWNKLQIDAGLRLDA